MLELELRLGLYSLVRVRFTSTVRSHLSELQISDDSLSDDDFVCPTYTSRLNVQISDFSSSDVIFQKCTQCVLMR